jgi:hypothetical protein
LIVLYEGGGNAELRQKLFVVAFKKVTATVREDPGLNEQDIGNPGRYYVHPFTPFISVFKISIEPATRP